MELWLENTCNHGVEFFPLSYFANISSSVELLLEETFLMCEGMAS